MSLRNLGAVLLDLGELDQTEVMLDETRRVVLADCPKRLVQRPAFEGVNHRRV